MMGDNDWFDAAKVSKPVSLYKLVKLAGLRKRFYFCQPPGYLLQRAKAETPL
jgi:hypothetical protein